MPLSQVYIATVTAKRINRDCDFLFVVKLLQEAVAFRSLFEQ